MRFDLSPTGRLKALAEKWAHEMFEAWRDHRELRGEKDAGFSDSDLQSLYNAACAVNNPAHRETFRRKQQT